MTDAERDRLIAALQARVQQLEEERDSDRMQFAAFQRVFMEPDPSNPSAGSKLVRIMEVVNTLEKGGWAVKLTFRAITTLAAAAAALAALWTYLGGRP